MKKHLKRKEFHDIKFPCINDKICLESTVQSINAPMIRFAKKVLYNTKDNGLCLLYTRL